MENVIAEGDKEGKEETTAETLSSLEAEMDELKKSKKRKFKSAKLWSKSKLSW